MKQNKIWTLLSFILWTLLLAAEVWLGVHIVQLDMLPAQYLAIIFAAMALAALIMAALMFFRGGKHQKQGVLLRQVIAWLLSVALSIGCLFATEAISKANDTISSVTNLPTVSAVVDVYVLKTDPAQTLDDTDGYTFAVTESYDWTNTTRALDGIRAELGADIATATYPTVFAMVDALYAGEADALLLNGAFVDILVELETYADFPETTKIIYEYSVTEDTPPQESTEPTPPETVPTAPTETNPPETVPAETQETIPATTQPALENPPFLIYLSGSDTHSKVLTTSRSDVNIIAVVNPQTKQLLLINTPRDYYIGNPAGSGALDKLTHCGIYGIDCSITALENLYGTEISYYAQINFTGFETLIDAVGGVTIYSNISFTTHHGNYPIYAGENHLNGHQALCYARERYALPGGDNDRGKNQMKLISAFVDKLSAGTIVSNYAGILDSLGGMFVTNMPQSVISDLVKMQLSDMANWEVLSYAVSGTGGSDIPFSMPGIYAYVTYPNEKTVEFASELIDLVLAGETLTREDLVPDQP